jgi:SAM-dependent methyltransferase
VSAPDPGTAAMAISDRIQERGSAPNDTPLYPATFVEDSGISRTVVLELNRAAAIHGWATALAQSADAAIRRLAGTIANVESANWHWIVDVPSCERALVINAGLGTSAHALAARFREVVALDPVIENVEFMRYRFSQQTLDNVTVVHGAASAAPMPAGSFDLVVMSGVLERAAMEVSGPAARSRHKLLSHAAELIRPGGYLFLAAANRFARGRFALRREPGFHPLSRRGYAQLLRACGVRVVETFLVHPDHRDMRLLVPFDQAILTYYSQNFGGRISRLRAAVLSVPPVARIAAEFGSSFAFIAYKPR